MGCGGMANAWGLRNEMNRVEKEKVEVKKEAGTKKKKNRTEQKRNIHPLGAHNIPLDKKKSIFIIIDGC